MVRRVRRRVAALRAKPARRTAGCGSRYRVHFPTWELTGNTTPCRVLPTADLHGPRCCRYAQAGERPVPWRALADDIVYTIAPRKATVLPNSSSNSSVNADGGVNVLSGLAGENTVVGFLWIRVSIAIRHSAI